MPEEIKLIQPAPVVRDEMGSFQHPYMPDFDEGDGDKCKTWVPEQGLTVRPAEGSAACTTINYCCSADLPISSRAGIVQSEALFS
ncbi:hypothetical protein [Pseudomonas sp. 18058]|uniref:hypothetical protein n=1 Tax=Pseudomonas sp. 18058 TaxID=2681406 RepID=UPI00135798AF|nr:hypothetical protein [Pseudomonas sp. 18058]